MHLYLVRHGRSQKQHSNRARLPGYHLTAKGRKEAKQAAEFLATKKIDLIYTSPLERAQETAQIIAAKAHARIIVTPDLNEWDLSCTQGLTKTQIKKLPLWNNYWYHPTKLKDGETLSTVAKRMMKFYQQLLKKYKKQNIVAVSHASPITSFILALKHHSLDEMFTIAPKRGWFPSTGGIIEVKNDSVKQVL